MTTPSLCLIVVIKCLSIGPTWSFCGNMSLFRESFSWLKRSHLLKDVSYLYCHSQINRIKRHNRKKWHVFFDKFCACSFFPSISDVSSLLRRTKKIKCFFQTLVFFKHAVRCHKSQKSPQQRVFADQSTPCSLFWHFFWQTPESKRHFIFVAGLHKIRKKKRVCYNTHSHCQVQRGNFVFFCSHWHGWLKDGTVGKQEGDGVIVVECDVVFRKKSCPKRNNFSQKTRTSDVTRKNVKRFISSFNFRSNPPKEIFKAKRGKAHM